MTAARRISSRAPALAMAALMALAVPAQAAMAAVEGLPPLRAVAEIDDGLLWVALADEFRDRCADIDARMLTALWYLNSLKRTALEMGYSRDQVRAYLKSDDEKARMRARGGAYLAAHGVDPDDDAGLCALGRAEIDRNSRIGTFLKAK